MQGLARKEENAATDYVSQLQRHRKKERACSPDNEVDASNARVEEDDPIDDEGHGLPESIKRAMCLNLEGDIPLVGGSTIQPVHSHSNNTCKGKSAWSQVVVTNSVTSSMLHHYNCSWR